MFDITPEIRSVIGEIEKDIQICGREIFDIQSTVVENITNRFDDKLERSIALLLFNSFSFYNWDETKKNLLLSINKFLSSTSRNENIIFILHREQSSSTKNNACHEKSSFFFTLLSLMISDELRRRTIGFTCENWISIDPKNITPNTIFCIVEDSIYSGNQLNNVISNLDKKIDTKKLHVICPFVRELFLQQSVSKPYTVHVEVSIPSLFEMLNSEDVRNKTCDQISEIEKTNPGAFDSDIDMCKGNVGLRVLNTIFPGSLKLTSIYFSHKTADATSIPLHWLLTLLGLGKFSLVDEDAHFANTHVKNSEGLVWSCMRGPYKVHKENLFVIFHKIFENNFDLRNKTLKSRIKSIFKK